MRAYRFELRPFRSVTLVSIDFFRNARQQPWVVVAVYDER
jgi:hypothetical protein